MLKNSLKKLKMVFRNAIFLYKLIWKEKKSFIFESLILILVNACSPFVTIIMPKFIINELTKGEQFSRVLWLVLIMFILNFIFSNVQAALQSFVNYSAKYLMIPLSMIFNKKNMEMDFEDTENPEILDLKEKAQMMVLNGNIADKYLLAVNELIINLLRILGLGYIISNISIYVLILIVLASILNTKYSIRIQKRNFQLNNESMLSTRKSEYYRNISKEPSVGKIIRINDLSDWIMKKTYENRKECIAYRDKMLKNSKKSETVSVIFGIMQQLSIYVFLLFKVVKENLGVGDYVMYTNSIMCFPTVFNSICGSYISVKDYGQYITQYQEFINRPDRMQLTKKSEVHFDGSIPTIEFKNVSFKYPRSEQYVLKDINITIAPGEKLSIIGDNGAGKTTFLKLLLRLYDVTDGEILINGRNVKDYDYTEYMQQIATVFQDYKLFAFSVWDNITLGQSAEANADSVDQVLSMGGMKEKIDSLPNKTQTTMSREFDENGVVLSGGEQQKLALCRALYKDASLVILDEPTASLSPLAENEIYQKFHQMVQDKSAIFVSHRLSSSHFCDKIAYFEDGKIVEYGSHAELMKLDDKYAKMYQLQASYYMEEEEGSYVQSEE